MTTLFLLLKPILYLQLLIIWRFKGDYNLKKYTFFFKSLALP